MPLYTAFLLPTSDGKFCEIGITLEEDADGYSGINLFPEGFKREYTFKSGTKERAEEAGQHLDAAYLQEKEAEKYLKEQCGLVEGEWYRDNGGTGLMMWVVYKKEKDEDRPMDEVVMKAQCREVLEKLRKSGLRETEMSAV